MKANYSGEGQRLKIHKYPDSILKKKSVAVEVFDEGLETLCQNMLHTMYKAPGIGLAAPQIGKSIRLIVLDVDYDRENIKEEDEEPEYQISNLNPYIFINPVITSREGKMMHQEGCLSLPEVFEDVERDEKIVVEYQDLKGEKHTLEADELLSICIQHEIDHLVGILFIDHISQLKRSLYQKKLIKEKKRACKK